MQKSAEQENEEDPAEELKPTCGTVLVEDRKADRRFLLLLLSSSVFVLRQEQEQSANHCEMPHQKFDVENDRVNDCLKDDYG